MAQQKFGLKTNSNQKPDSYQKEIRTELEIRPKIFRYSSRTVAPVPFSDGHDIPRGAIDGHGNPMVPISGQRWFSDDPSLIMEKF